MQDYLNFSGEKRPSLDSLNQTGWRKSSILGLIVWFLTMTAVPIAIWVVGERSVSTTMFLATVAQATLIFILLGQAWGGPRALLTAAGVAFLGWLVEYIGSNTGLPFGTYQYTEKLQPQIAHVPVLVPLAWFMMLPVCWAVAEKLVGRPSGWRFMAAAAAAMTAWDLFLDPQMVNWQFWLWMDVPSINYFGIPFLNYAGWFVSSWIMTVTLRPPSLRAIFVPMMTVYVIVWLMQSGGLLLFWGLPGPAVVGFLGMGCFVWAVNREKREERISK